MTYGLVYSTCISTENEMKKDYLSFTQMYKFVLTWHKTLKEKGLDILEDHGLELFCQVLTRSGDFCIAKRKERSLFLDCRYITFKK